jgi:predicted nucleic acid-binding protein
MTSSKIFYYDTGAFWRFFLFEFIQKTEFSTDVQRYSTLDTNINIRRILSPWTIEEFFHAYIIKQSRKIKKIEIPEDIEFPEKFFEKEIMERTEVLTKVKSFLFLFSQGKLDTSIVNNLFLSLIMAARENSILSVKTNDNKIDSKDLLHLAYALYFNSHSFITCDRGFKLIMDVEVIRRMLPQYKLKKIVILKEDLTEIIEKLDFSTT